jgi:uncharacterized protein (TIGR02246 family)
MHKLPKLALAAVVIAASLSALAGPADDRVAKAFAAWNAAFNKGDAKAVAAFYAPDAVVLPASHTVASTPADIEQFFASFIKNHVTGHVLEPFKVIESGNTLVVASKWSAKGQDDKGNPTTFSGLATHVLQQQADGSYKLKLHTFN